VSAALAAEVAQIGDVGGTLIDRGEVLIAGMAAMLITIFLGPKAIEVLRNREFGQQIREEGPQGHHEKAGTPTMGGLIVLIAVAIPYLVLSERDTESLTVFGVMLGSAALGFADDWIKIVKRRSLGLAARYKLLAQIALAFVLWWFAFQEVGLDPTLQVRTSSFDLYLGPAVYLILTFLVLAGFSNGVNLSDGLDGLAAGCCSIVFLAFLAITITTGQAGMALLCSCLVGATIGFLWFNAHPATIFMGDTGSLGLGGAIGALAIMTQTEVLLLVIGGVFVLEAASVAVQVLAFKATRRRVFLMAPIHHHFEMLAWSETKIMLRFWIIGAVFAGIGYTLFQNSLGA
jgi:phospho-N-acetylmuramoyl-pentapeptide-transferase